MSNQIIFSQGKRYQLTQIKCPNCGSSLYIDKMDSKELMRCFSCNCVMPSTTISKAQEESDDE